MAPSTSASSSPTKQKRKHKDIDAKSTKSAATATATASTSADATRSGSSKKVKDKKAKADSPSKKAKVEAGRASLKLANTSGTRSSNGVALASFPDYLPAESAEFDLYRGDALPGSSSLSGSRGSGLKDERLLLAGGTKTMEYLGDNFQLGSAPDLRGYSGEYMVGIYDPSSSSVTLRAAPLFTVSRSIKALKSLDPISFEQDESVSAFYQQKKGLEGTFGNAKSRKARVNAERMKVDVSQVFGSVDEVTESITQSTANLPSAEELQAIDFKSRPIPAHEPSATKPVEVYPIRNLVDPSVLKLVPIDAVLDMSSEDEVRAWLEPIKTSFLATRVWNAVQNAQFDQPDPPAGAPQEIVDSFTRRQAMAAEDAKERVRVAMYVVYLVSFMLLYQESKNVKAIKEKLGLESSSEGKRVVRDITERFTNAAKGSSKLYMSGTEQARYLSHVCALLLHIDHFTVAVDSVAKGLQLEPHKLMDIFRAIGCTPGRKAVASDADGGAEFGDVKRERCATLSLPLKFPAPRKKRVQK